VADYKPLKQPGQIGEAPDTDTILAQGVKANAGQLVLEDPVAGPQTLSQLAAGGGGGGDVNGPAGAVAGNLPSYDGATGKLIDDSGVAAADTATAISHAALTSGNPHSVTADEAGAINVMSPAPADEELILGDGTPGNVRGGSLRLNEIGSTGVAGDPANIVEDDGGGNVRINAHTAVFKTSATILAPHVRVEVGLIAAIAIPLNTVQWVGVDYNGGTPIAIVTTDPTVFNLLTKQPLATVSRDSSGVYPVPIPLPLTEYAARAYTRIYDTDPLAYNEGLIIDVAGGGSDKFQMTAGSLYIVYLLQTIAGLDTSTAGTFDVFTGSTGGGFSSQTLLTDYPQDQYNDGTTTPATLNTNRWGNIWWYLDVASNAVLGFLGSSNSNDLATAGAEAVPSDLPPRLRNALLIGRFLILRDTPASTVAESSFQTSFQGEGVTNHSSLSGLTDAPDAGHTQLQTRAEKSAASGYGGLDANTRLIEPAQVIHETGGPTNLTVGAIADGELVARVGSALVGQAGGVGGALNIGFRTRTTIVNGINTTPQFIAFDQEDNGIPGFFTYSGGTFTAQKSFSALVYTEGAMSWVSDTEPKCWIDIVKNALTAIGTNTANVYSSLLQQNSIPCAGFASFALNDTLRVYWYTTAGGVSLVAGTPKVAIIPLEVS
jgi:hypothetical protein